MREFSRPVLKQFQKTSEDEPAESRAYYWGIPRLTQVKARQTRTVHRGHENKSLEAEEVIEQSSFQNELHQTSTRIQPTPTTSR